MSSLLLLIVLSWAILGLVSWLGWQLLRQNGRILLQLEEVEKRLDTFEFGDEDEVSSAPPPNGEGTNSEEARANRFGNRSMTRSRIKRDGLKAGEPAPDFRLPGLDGTERSLQDFRGRHVLLVFSDPHCGPCNALAPHLQKFHRENRKNEGSTSPPPTQPGDEESAPLLQVLMISRGEPRENRAKVKALGLTFPVLLQQRWEISCRYAIFATPVAYLIGPDGVILEDVAVGVEPILALLVQGKKPVPAVPVPV